MSRIHLLAVTCFQIVICVVFWLTVSTGALAAPAETSLRLVPEDAAFYRACFDGGRQLEAVFHSQAWAKLRAMPVWGYWAKLEASPAVQLALQTGMAQIPDAQPALAQARSFWNAPQTQDLLKLLADMFDQEVFVYGDAGFAELAEVLDEVLCQTLYEPTLARLLAQGPAGANNCPHLDALVAALAQRADRLVISNLVVGFKVRDRQRAIVHVGKLELALGGLCWSAPALRGRMGRATLGDATYLTLTLDGSLIPAASPGQPAGDPKADDTRRLVEALRRLRLVLAIGVKQDYLLVSIGSSLDGLAALGQGKPLLDRPEMEPLRRTTDGRLTSVCYRSQALRERFPSCRRHVAALAAAFDKHASALAQDPRLQERLRRDAAALAADVDGQIRARGAIIRASYWTARGIECYQYDYSEHPWRVGYRGFALLDHLGGDPLVAVSYRAAWTPQQHDLWVKWLGVADGYLDDYVLRQIEPPWRKRCRVAAAVLRAALREANNLAREVVFPTLADGQIALVLTAERSASGTPGRFQPVVVLDSGSAERLRQAYLRFWRLYEDVADALADAPPAEQPRPAAPAAGPEEIWTWASTPEQARRLAASTPLDDGGLLSESKRKAATIAYVHWAALVDLARPSIEDLTRDVVRRVSGSADAAALEARQNAAIGQVRTVLECLQVLRRVSQETFVEGQALVTHTVWELRDVP